MNCWASSISECDGKQSREHYVSKCLFEGKSATVKGLKWCIEDFKSIPVANLASNILCKKHNEQLSEVDNEAKKFKDILIKCEEGQIVDLPNRKNQYIHIDGKLLTRWFTKTFCNMLETDKISTTKYIEFVQRSYNQPTKRNIKVYYLAYQGYRFNVEKDHPLGFGYNYKENGDVIADFRFFGLPWILLNFDLNKGENIELCRPPSPIDKRQLLEKPKEIKLNTNGKIYHIMFQW